MNLRPAEDKCYGGLPQMLPQNLLPTYRDVGLCLEEYKVNQGKGVSESIELVTTDIISVHEHASIPTLPRSNIRGKVRNLTDLKTARIKELQMDKRRGHVAVIDKYRKKGKNGKVKKKLTDLIETLFPAADEKKIPAVEQEFYDDQKSE